MLPHDFLNLPQKEKAFIMAAIDIRVEEEKKEQKKIERAK
jgi:hypothetical protein